MSFQAFNRARMIVGRWFGGAILCFFALVPGWIISHAVLDAIADPKTIDWRWLLAIAICASLMYFLLLMAFRAFTGRGRKRDGGLLPPLAIQVFAALFAALGASVSAIGLHEGELGVTFAGLLHFLAGVAVFRMAGLRRKLLKMKAEAR